MRTALIFAAGFAIAYLLARPRATLEYILTDQFGHVISPRTGKPITKDHLYGVY